MPAAARSAGIVDSLSVRKLIRKQENTFNSIPAKPLLCMLNYGGFFFLLVSGEIMKGDL